MDPASTVPRTASISNSGAKKVTDWASRISESSKDEDEKILCQCLEEYRDSGYPKFLVRKYLAILEGLEDVPDRTTEWSQGRANLLLQYFDRQHKQKLLYGAIENLEPKDEKPFKLPDEDKNMYFVVYQLIRVDPELAFEPCTGKQTAFTILASQGANFIVDFVLERLKSLLSLRFPTSAEELKEHLFSKLIISDDSSNTALGFAVEEGHKDIVRILLAVDKRLGSPEYLKEHHIKKAIGECQIDIMVMILDAQPTIAGGLPKLIVEYGPKDDKDMWKAMVHYFEDSLRGSSILHLAVQYGKLEIIDWLVRRFPDMVIQRDRNDRVALWYNTDQEIKESVRALIVPEIVRLCDPLQMKELLHIANDTPRQACLDLRVFNKDTHDFAHFVQQVKSNIRTPSGLDGDPAPRIEFESVLRYVHFPDLSQTLMSEDPKSERQEVPLILLWLHQRGVEKILRLVVPDCRVNPLDEDTICESLKKFVIEELNWRRLDLGIEPIMSLAPQLGILHLYSSGNWAVLSHWVGEGGLNRLKNLRELHITIVKESMTSAQAASCEKRIEEQMESLRSKCRWEWSLIVKIEKWSQGTKSIQKEEDAASTGDAEEKSASSDIKLDRFVSGYMEIQQARLESTTKNRLKPSRKIKIALIDTGIGALGDRSQSQIKPGISFGRGMDRESESPWWIPSNEHGPQMADIITSIDPFCEIHPVKITDDTDEAVKSSPIIDAIRWAVAQNVDIISLSLVLFNNPEGLHDAVLAASQNNIVIICSTADRGNNQQKVYPAQYLKDKKTDCLIPIAGCDQYGKLTDWSTETEAKYHFLGKDVTASCEGLMTKSSKAISGSSVATAIAAGTASLVLACSLLALRDDKYSRKQQIEIYFEKMQTEENRSHQLKYVEPAIMFGEQSIAGRNLETYIKQKFGQDR